MGLKMKCKDVFRYAFTSKDSRNIANKPHYFWHSGHASFTETDGNRGHASFTETDRNRGHTSFKVIDRQKSCPPTLQSSKASKVTPTSFKKKKNVCPLLHFDSHRGHTHFLYKGRRAQRPHSELAMQCSVF